MTGPRRMSREDVMTAREVADLLGLTERTVYDWARTGRLPSKRLGSMVVRFLRDEIEDYLRHPDRRGAA